MPTEKLRPTLAGVWVLVLSFVQGGANAQDPAAPAATPAPGSREATWPAPTAEDWQKPCLIKFQRSFEDALAVSKETGKPILICVNMDGEIASEHYAGVRYREPASAKYYEPYVAVIASVYRHTPRDFDDQGQRILCPRFGSVTCGEHIAIEPVLFEKFFEGRRIAPRHIALDQTGQEAYDVFYAFDTKSVLETVRDGAAKLTSPNPPVVKGDRTIQEKVASQDNGDRSTVEAAYLAGDAALRRSLLEAALARGEEVPVDLLRLAIFGLDPELAKLGRQALAQTRSEGALDLLSEALRDTTDASERATLLAALERIGEASPRARTLAVVHQGLGVRSGAVDVAGWNAALDGGATYEPSAESAAIEARLVGQDKVFASSDPEAHVALAEAFIESALAPGSEHKSLYARALFTDARDTARKAEGLGAKGWRVNAVLAVAAFHLGEQAEAYSRAEAAVAGMSSDPKSFTSMVVLGLFAESRARAIWDAAQAKKNWPPEWLADVNAAYAVLAKHPFGTDSQLREHYDFLVWLGGKGQAGKVLDAGIARFPESWDLHERLRRRALEEKGVEGIEGVYAALLAKPDAPPILEWYAGYASLAAGDFHRRFRRAELSMAAYDRGIAHFEKYIAAMPNDRATADHYVAIALGSRARLAYEKKDDEGALNHLLASFARRESAAASPDGMNLTAVDTAKMLLARLKAEQRTELAAKLQSALSKLDPKLLELPAYEREQPGAAPAGGPRRRGGRGQGGPGGPTGPGNPGGEGGRGGGD